MTLLQPMMVMTLLLTGLGVALLGSVKIPLARRLQIDEGRVGGLISLFGFVIGPVILAAGFLTDSIGPQPVLIAGAVVYAISLALLGGASNYGAALAAVLLFSAGWALQINVGNVLIVPAFKTEQGTAAAAFNLANVFFGLGAFLTPLAVAFLVSVRSLSFTLCLIAGVAVLPALLALGVTYDPPPPVADEGFLSLFGQPVLWFCAFALFFYGPLEASVGGWATSYLVEQGVPENSASTWLSGFWLLFMASRLATALVFPLLPSGLETLFILVLSALCIALMAYLVVCRNRGLAVILIPLAGLIFGPIFPTLTAVLLRPISPHLSGRAIGLFFLIGGIGWSLIPMLIGAYAKRTSIQRGFVIALGAACGLAGVALILFLSF